jgi:hypothetical protein
VKTFQRNTDVHNLNTKCKDDLHMPNVNLTKYQYLPFTTENLNRNIKVIKPAFKGYLLTHSFYSVDYLTFLEKL